MIRYRITKKKKVIIPGLTKTWINTGVLLQSGTAANTKCWTS